MSDTSQQPGPAGRGAIVLAGGRSRRMGRDKAALAVGGRTLVEHVVAQVRPHVAEVLVSVETPGRLADLGLRVVADRQPGQGPMMGIGSALALATHHLNLVVACDIPELPPDLVGRLFEAARAADAAVPVLAEGVRHPLLAVYHRRVLPRLEGLLAAGRRSVLDLLDACDVRYLPAGVPLDDLDTPEAYAAHLESRGERP